eukprot:12834277-Alexandrium_andersonii.AAC.1
MSASLVGSEMCIRDRCKKYRGWLGCQERHPLRCSQAWVSLIVCLIQPVPVSYTHLTLPTICSV